MKGKSDSGLIQEIWRQQRPEVQIFPVVTTDTLEYSLQGN